MSTSSTLAAQNKAALDRFIQTPVNMDMIHYLAQKASAVIRCDASDVATTGDLPTPPTTPPRNDTSVSLEPGLPSLEEFITSIVQQSHVQVSTLMPALIYLSRLRSKLPPVAQGIPSTVHRIFLASLILAAKNLNDSSPKNKHWARYTTVPGYPGFGFTNSEVNLMEKQLLYLLDWDLRVTNEDLYFHLDHFLAPIRVKQQQAAERKMQSMLVERERQQQQAQAEMKRRQQSQSSISYLASSQAHLNLPHIISHARHIYDSPQHANPSPTAPPSCHSRSASLYTSSRSSSRAPPTRTPSLSPPSRCDSSASYSTSSASSIASASPSPIPSSHAYSVSQGSITYPSKPQEAKIHMHGQDYYDEYNYQYGYMHPEVPEVVYMLPKQDKTLPPRPRDDDLHAKPAKKLKTSATNLLSRFLGGGNAGVAAAC